jgi:hypothetical protein
VPEEPCAVFADDLVALALGLLAGAERAELLGHLAACPACRSDLAALAQTGDLLVQAVPPEEPPPGFEARVLDRVATLPAGEPPTHATGPRGRAPGGRRARWLLAAAAAAVLAVAGFAVGREGSATGDPGGSLTGQYVHTLQALGGRSLLAGALRGPDGRRIGEAFVYQGVHPWPSWVFVQLAPGPTRGSLWVVVDDAAGRTLLSAGSLEARGAQFAWGRALSLPGHLPLPLEVSVFDQRGLLASGTLRR